MGRYKNAHTRSNSMRGMLEGRGFLVHVRMCRRGFNCTYNQCTGEHYSIRGNGICRNNLTFSDAEDLIKEIDCAHKRPENPAIQGGDD